MDTVRINQIFADTAYVRTGGTEEELRCARYLMDRCADLEVEARLEDFEVDMARIKRAALFADGEEIPCKGYFNAGSGEIEAPLYYLTGEDKGSLAA